MNNIVHLDFGAKDKSGYILNGRKVDGVYNGNLAAMTEYGNVYIGTKVEKGILDTTFLSLDEMNQFCLMWLCMYDPNLINFDYDEGDKRYKDLIRSKEDRNV